jgi:hypothetical protein
MNEKYQDQEEQTPAVDEQQPEGMTWDQWDVNQNPDEIQNWASAEDEEACTEYWNKIHPPAWDGISKPNEDDFDTYDDYREAQTLWLIQQSVGGMAQAQARPPEDPDDEDVAFVQKHEAFNLFRKYAEDEAKYQSAGDVVKQRHARMMKESWENELNKLEKEFPTPLHERKKEEFRSQYMNDIEAALDEKHFAELKRQLGEDKAFNDANQRLNGIYDMYPDIDELHFLRGVSRDGRHPDWHIAKIKLPPEVKANILHTAKLNQGRPGSKTVEDRLVELGYIERLKVEYDEDTKLEDKDPEHMSQSEYEAWRRKQGALPKYHRMF